jgi:allantoicase
VTVPPGFTALPDLASRRLGGSVVAANDEFFAEKENLIKPEPPVFAPGEFGHKGKVYDGWETRRRREPGHDHAIIRLGVPGVVHGVVVDTSFFRGNYPPEVSVEAVSAEGYPSPAELAELAWQPLTGRERARGDGPNHYHVTDRRRWTHLRLSIYPDGGVARLRAHGEPVPDPAFLTGMADLAAAENGGWIVDCSDAFYSSAVNLIMPGLSRGMAEGWETARRRDSGYNHVTIALAGEGVIGHVEVDTSYFLGNAPGSARLLSARLDPSGLAAPGIAAADGALPGPADSRWREVLPRTRLQPDTRHRFLVDGGEPASHVRLEVFPDGGLARLRVHGTFTADALGRLRDRYLAALPGRPG